MMEQDTSDKIVVSNWSCFVSVGACLLHSITYIASLYMWRCPHDRNHPDTILKRFISVFGMLFVSPLFLYLALDVDVLQKRTLWEILGLRLEGLLQAFVMPLFLTMILFLGPLYMQVVNGIFKVYTEPMHWLNNLTDLAWLRVHIVAPLSEEFSFRSCMLPILLQCFQPLTAVFICPIFFGAAHFHHVFENVKNGVPMKRAVVISVMHCTYTTVFGTYSAFLFYRTGHFAATFITHAFCNHMGFPDFPEILQYERRQQISACVLFVTGFLTWCLLLNPLTEPKWYKNQLFF